VYRKADASMFPPWVREEELSRLLRAARLQTPGALPWSAVKRSEVELPEWPKRLQGGWKSSAAVADCCEQAPELVVDRRD
jgi:hypothetical protein